MASYHFNPASKHEVLLFPFQYLAVNGAEARHDTVIGDKAVDERGTPKTEYALIKRNENRIFYDAAADYDALTADQKSRAFWLYGNTGLRDRYINRGVIVAR